jgi:hypothetical protein
VIGLAAQARRVATVTAVAITLVAVQETPSGAAWAVALGSGGSAQASSGVLTAPGGVTTACTGGAGNRNQITVSWTAAPRAGGYTVEQSTTSATSGFTTLASGVTATSHVISPPAGTYWFRVTTVRGSWTSTPSTAAGPRTTTNNSCA